MVVVLGGLWLVSQWLLTGTGRSGAILRNPYSWFVSLWLVQFGLLALPLFSYEYTTSAGTLFYIVVAHLAFIGGMALALIGNGAPRKANLVHVRGRSDVMLGLLATGLFGQSAVTLNHVLSQTVAFSSRLTQEGYQEARQAQLEEGMLDMSFLGPLFGPMSMLAALGYIAIAYYGFQRGMRAPWTRIWSPTTILAALLAAMIAFEGLVLQGGRAQLAYVLVFLCAPFALGRGIRNRADGVRRKRLRPHQWVGLAAVAAMMFVASVWFQQFRSNDRDPELDMWIVEAAEPHPVLDGVVEDSEFVGYALLQIGYFTSSSNMLDYYMSLRHHPGPFYGRYNFPVIYRTFGRFLPGYDPDYWQNDRKELFKPLEDRGRHGNVWTSLFRDLIADFGKTGALLTLGIFGWAAQRTSDAFHRKPDAFRAALLTLLCTLATTSALHSLLFITVFTWVLPFLTVIVVTGIWLPRAHAAGRLRGSHPKAPVPNSTRRRPGTAN